MPILLALLVQVPEKYVEAAKTIEIPELVAWADRSPQHKKAVDIIGDRANWAKGLQRVDEKLGLFVAKPKIRVVVAENDEPRPAKGGGRRGEGEVHFNLRKMVEAIRKLEDFEKMRGYGKDVKFRVPPTPLPALIHHELTHVFAGTYDELWLTEGLATFTADETAHLWDFQERKAQLDTLDKTMTDRDAYARGYCGVAWLESKLGAEKFKALVARLVEDGAGARKAIEEATGLGWDAVLAAERESARELLKKHTP